MLDTNKTSSGRAGRRVVARRKTYALTFGFRRTELLTKHAPPTHGLGFTVSYAAAWRIGAGIGTRRFPFRLRIQITPPGAILKIPTP